MHDIGKIGFPDELLGLPVNLIVGDHLGIFRRHPARAEQLLMPLEDLRGVAAVLRAHMERHDGAGLPGRHRRRFHPARGAHRGPGLGL
ncbi:hypothetical protein LP420_05635 [Massilia sp. B-10]|nr:hypothetical protein LP420_05635 [Massilia sp. B-10]